MAFIWKCLEGVIRYLRCICASVRGRRRCDLEIVQQGDFMCVVHNGMIQILQSRLRDLQGEISDDRGVNVMQIGLSWWHWEA